MQKKIKVNLLFNEFPLTNQTYIYEMVKDLNNEQIVDLGVFCINKGKDDHNLSIRQLPKNNFRKLFQKVFTIINPNYRGLSTIEIESLSNSVDIIHLQHSHLLNKLKGILKNKSITKPKVIVTLRGSDTYIKPWYFKNWKRYYREYIPFVDALIVQSEHQKMYLNTWGVNQEKVHVIPSTIKKVDFSPKKLIKGKIKIVSSFRMCWEKNIDANLRVIKRLVEKGYQLEYNIYGYGPDRGQVFYLVNEFNLNEQVNIKGRVDNELYLKELEDNHIYLQLSVVESLSISVIEAQSRGIPAVVSDSSGIAETIIHEKSGFTVPYFDIEAATEKIVELISNNDKYQKFSQAAIDYVNSKYTSTIEVDKHLKLYSKILQNE